MRKSRYSDSQIMTILELNESGVSVPDLNSTKNCFGEWGGLQFNFIGIRII